MEKKSKKRILCLLLTAAMTISLAGCGKGSAGGSGAASLDVDSGAGSTGSSADTQAQNGQSGDSTDGQTAMGRYVEEETDLSEQLLYPRSMCMLEDGSIVIMDSDMGLLVSKDKGITWDTETPAWFTSMKDVYISEMTMAPDGTAAVVYDSDTSDDDYTPAVKLVLPDGEEVPVELALTEEEMYIRQVTASDDGRIFAKARESIYEIYHDGSGRKILTPEDASWICAKDSLMFMDSDRDGIDAPFIYDMGAGEYVEDDVLTEFVDKNYRERYYNGSDYGTMILVPGDDGTVYTVGYKGIHRHAVGGNMVEQIVDGNLSILNNPDYHIVSMLQPEENVFLVFCSNRKLIRFTYDPNVPSVPENLLTIYSLEEDDNIRQAISLYQMKNPDTFVSYQIGMSNGDSVTRDDAVKKLNTEIMAGTGPDLIVLDNLPLSSYVSKGLLLDLTDYLAQYSATEPLFDNAIDSLKVDGRAYMAPATIDVPMIAAREEYTANMTDLSGVGEAVEKLREEHPGENIIGICSTNGIMKRFAATSAPKWIKADGTVDLECIGAYLESCKRIYDAQMDGLDAEIVQLYTERSQRMAAYENIDVDRMDWGILYDTYNYIAGSQYILTGWAEADYGYDEVTSLDKVKGLEDTNVIYMNGQCSNVFKPGTMLGINAMSGRIDAAKGFMDAFLSADVQKAYSGFPVNQKAYDMQFTPKAGDVKENNEYLYTSVSDADGLRVEYIIYWPTDEQIAAFKAQLASVNTAYIPDSVLEEAVFASGGMYMTGQRTLQDTLKEIEKSVALYMAE